MVKQAQMMDLYCITILGHHLMMYYFSVNLVLQKMVFSDLLIIFPEVPFHEERESCYLLVAVKCYWKNLKLSLIKLCLFGTFTFVYLIKCLQFCSFFHYFYCRIIFSGKLSYKVLITS